MKTKSKVPAKLRKLMWDSIFEHAKIIGVSHYKIDLLYEHENKSKNCSCLPNVMGMCVVDRKYLQAVITVFPCTIEMWKEKGDKFIKEVIAHEVSHIATEHMKDLIYSCFKDEGEVKDAWESLTEMISRISLKVHAKNS